jgi:hypothetical protein
MTSERKQISFWLDPEMVERFEKCENKTRVLNEALRAYFEGTKERQELKDRIMQLEEFRNRFMAYIARKDNEPHSEFCDCSVCTSNRRSFRRSVKLMPEPETGEKIIDIIIRAINQARQQSASVVFSTNNYRFSVDEDSEPFEEYHRYMTFVAQKEPEHVTISIPNPWLNKS